MIETNRDRYVVSFMPGSRGRFISNIIYKLVNNLSDPIEFTNLNSAHNFIDITNINFVSKASDFIPNLDRKKVFFTHLYPNNDWHSDMGVIFINVPLSSLPEVLLNAAIKNVFPKLEKQSANEELNDGEKNFIKSYKKSYPGLDVDLLHDANKQKEYLEFVFQDGFRHKLLYTQFVDNESFDGFRIEYDTFFFKEEGCYATLKKLCELVGVPYNVDVHNEFEEYDKTKYKLFEKYCPWFLKE